MPPTKLRDPLETTRFSEERAQPSHSPERHRKMHVSSWRHLKDGKFVKDEEVCQRSKWKMNVERSQDESF